MPSSYDINMPSEPVRILRSALPYLGNTIQHQVSLALKCMELQDILQSSIPSSEDSSLMRGGEENGEPTQNISDRRLQMLQSIRGACNPEHVGYVDTVIQTFHMQSMIQQIPPASSSVPSADTPVIPFLRNVKTPSPSSDSRPEETLENHLKSMLNPQQQALFQSFSQILKQPETTQNSVESEVAHG